MRCVDVSCTVSPQRIRSNSMDSNKIRTIQKEHTRRTKQNSNHFQWLRNKIDSTVKMTKWKKNSTFRRIKKTEPRERSKKCGICWTILVHWFSCSIVFVRLCGWEFLGDAAVHLPNGARMNVFGVPVCRVQRRRLRTHSRGIVKRLLNRFGVGCGVLGRSAKHAVIALSLFHSQLRYARS